MDGGNFRWWKHTELKQCLGLTDTMAVQYGCTVGSAKSNVISAFNSTEKHESIIILQRICLCC